jgi:hypothetical protein
MISSAWKIKTSQFSPNQSASQTHCLCCFGILQVPHPIISSLHFGGTRLAYPETNTSASSILIPGFAITQKSNLK